MEEKLIFQDKNLQELKENIFSKKYAEKTIFNFLNAHSVYLFKKNKNFKEKILNKENINFIDGATISWILSIKNFRKIKRVRGGNFTREILEDTKLNNKKHLLLGESENELDILRKNYSNLNMKNSKLSLIPHIQKDKFDDSQLIKEIKHFSPDFIWIKLGNPKQEILANDIIKNINKGYIFNVGAAIDFLTKKKRESPKFMQKLGFEWLYRLITDFKHTLIKVIKSFLGFFWAFRLIRLDK